MSWQKIELKKVRWKKIKNTEGSAMSVGSLVVYWQYGLYVFGHQSNGAYIRICTALFPVAGSMRMANGDTVELMVKFLFSVKALSKVSRAKFCEKLKQKMPVEYQKIRTSLWKQAWVVFAKRPFLGVQNL